MEISGLELQLKAVSGFVTLWQPGSVLKFMGPATTEGPVTA